MTFSKTRFPPLVLGKLPNNEWSFFDTTEPGAPARVGYIYPTKYEAMINLESYAKEFGVYA